MSATRRPGKSFLVSLLLTFFCVSPLRLSAAASLSEATGSSEKPDRAGQERRDDGSALTLLEAVNIALQHNLSLRANRHDFETQRMVRQQTRAGFSVFPTLNASATDISGSESVQSYSLTTTYKDTLGGSASATASVTETGAPRSVSSTLDLSYSLKILEQGGSAFAKLPLKRADLNFVVAEISIWEQTQATILSTVSSFLNAWTALQELQVRRATLEQAKTAYEGDLLKFELGVINVPDRARSELNYLNAEASYLTAERALKDALQSLAVTLGYPPDHPLRISETLQFVLPPLPDHDKLFEERLKFNPTIRRQELQKALQELSLFEARRRALPEGALDFGYSLTSSGNTWDLGTKLNQWSVRAGFSITLPLNTIQDRLAYRIARNNYASFLIRYEETRRNTIQQLEAQWRGIEENQRRLAILQKSLESARLSYTLIEEAYKEGLQRFLDFQVAQQQYQDAQLRELQARASLLRALLQFYRDFGYDLLPILKSVFGYSPAPVSRDHPVPETHKDAGTDNK
ncbi:MAG: TolC family protein [bacterium JZ-2024 1]